MRYAVILIILGLIALSIVACGVHTDVYPLLL